MVSVDDRFFLVVAVRQGETDKTEAETHKLIKRLVS
jgi:hypothetical protein